MRSIYRRITVWALGTIALAIVGMLILSLVIARLRPPGVDFLSRTLDLQQEVAQRTLAERGREGLRLYLLRLDELFEARHVLVDQKGQDLITGLDYSDAVPAPSRQALPPRFRAGRFVVAGPGDGTGSRLLIFVPPHSGFWGMLPYVIWTVLVIAILTYVLALGIARPLNELRDAVDRFGAGDLSARIQSVRRDEIGQVARSFDAMAERIETLLAAERRLLQDVSHELRSPLARLGFAVELARSHPDPGPALDRIARDVDRIAALVGTLLELTRAEGDPATREHVATNLAHMLNELVDDASLEADARGCRIDVDATDDCTVDGDPELLRRAIENVLRNALRYAPAGSAVRVKAERDRGSQTVRVVVRDEGVGVPEDSLEAIFHPFFRVGDDRSRENGGVGLGLTIARRAVLLHQGAIQARNAHPGLEVTIELPTQAGSDSSGDRIATNQQAFA